MDTPHGGSEAKKSSGSMDNEHKHSEASEPLTPKTALIDDGVSRFSKFLHHFKRLGTMDDNASRFLKFLDNFKRLGTIDSPPINLPSHALLIVLKRFSTC